MDVNALYNDQSGSRGKRSNLRFYDDCSGEWNEEVDIAIKVPAIWISALSMIRDELGRIMWNINQEIYDNPFDNSGNTFDELEEFTVEAYSWDDDYDQPYNFKWRDVEIGWYKHLCREAYSKNILTPELASEMLDECLDTLLRYEKLHLEI